MPKYFTFLAALLLGYSSLNAQVPTTTSGPVSATPIQLPLVGMLYFPDTPSNYVRTYIPVKAIQDSSLITMSSVVEDVLVSTTYMDAFGRPIQQIGKQMSPAKKDNVSLQYYDDFGRQQIAYLPYVDVTDNGLFKYNSFYKDSVFYKTHFTNEHINYSKSIFDGSPLNIIDKTLAAGNSWGGANVGISFGHRANSSADSVVLWSIAITSEDDVPAMINYYLPGTLTVEEVTDEREVKVIKYINELGQVVLIKTQLASSPGTAHVGWLCTYYVYDEMGSLRIVIPPKATDLINSNTYNWSLSANPSIKSDLCFSYYYDSRGRVIMKSVPGKGKSYVAYDLYDRVAMTQDPHLRPANQWSFAVYDAQGRASKSGIVTMSIIKDSVIAQASRSLAYPALSNTHFITSEIYYDDYSWVSSSGTSLTTTLETANINGTNFNTSYNTSPLYAQQIVTSVRTRGSITGTKKLKLNTTNYMFSLNVYDDNGRSVQTKEINYSGGIDVATVQYDFAGKVLRSHLAHQKSGNNTQAHTLLTKYGYDHGGRVKTLVKNLNGLGDKTITDHTYNELGQLQSKVIGNSIETQNFTYNIRGWLLGINKDHVNNSTPSNYFGETIAYDYGFSNVELNGNKSGIKWRMAGDSNVRAYGYTYDNNNRLVDALFTQQNSGATSWTNDQANFSVGNLSYDGNGNIHSMSQRGLLIGSSSLIDSLVYQYFPTSNRLQKVSDYATAGGNLGDFKDSSSTGDDYTYDANGNINRDNNRYMHTAGNAPGAVFNFLDKADSIVIAGKATTYYYYDAAGVMQAKKVHTYLSSGTVIKNYEYLNGFVYLNDTLQYAMIEGGRIRYAKKKAYITNATYYAYEYDYFISDHMGNVRTVLTEGRDTSVYMATMETANMNTEDALFANAYTPVNTSSAKPYGFDYDGGNNHVSKLTGVAPSGGTGGRMGPSIVLKVMAGDKVQINTMAFYNQSVQAPDPNVNLVSEVLSALTGGVISGSGGKLNAGNNSAVSTALSPNVTNFLDNNRAYDNSKPKAYLNWILFDNQFKYVSSNSGAIQVEAGSSRVALVAGLQTMVKNGYLYVYVSNESLQNVYFDDLTVTHTTGALMQEQSYYPYGLQMHGLSDKAVMKSTTAYKYNAGSELEDEDGIGYYNTFYRKYDAQIGRFTGVDLLAEVTYGMTPFQFGSNNPVKFNDPYGDLTSAEFNNIIGRLWATDYGGSWSSKNPNSLTVFGDQQAAEFFGAFAAGGNAITFDGDGQGRIGDLFITAIKAGTYNNSHGINIGGYYENGGKDGEPIMGSFFFADKTLWTAEERDLADEFGQLFTAASIVWGGTELGLHSMRQNHGPKILARKIGFGTQRTAKALKGSLSVVSKLGKAVGAIGYGLQLASVGSKLLNGEKISTSEKVGLGISTALVGAAWITAGTLAAPAVAAGALVYGVFQLGSYLFTGQSVEENLFDE